MLAIISTHPIQYQTPIWQALARDGRVPFEVWYLTGHGTEPTLDTEFGKTFQWDIETLSGYSYRMLETAPGASPPDFWQCRLTEKLRLRLKAAGVTAVWIQGWNVLGYWQFVREAKKAGAQVWLRGESNDMRPVPWWKKFAKKILLGWFFSHVDRFFYIGSGNRRLYCSFGVDEAKLLPAPYAVDNDRFARQAEALRPSRAEIRRSWGIAEDAFCVLFCGKFIAKKRPGDLAKAAQLLRDQGRLSGIHLLFAGSGELGGALRQACSVVYDAEAGAGPADPQKPPASFAGFLNQTQISRAYVAADCLVLPSDYGETWGLVVNEALASGLPCIVSDACGCAEDLIASEWIYPLGDAAALAGKLENLHADGALPHKPPPTFDQSVATLVESWASLGRK